LTEFARPKNGDGDNKGIFSRYHYIYQILEYTDKGFCNCARIFSWAEFNSSHQKSVPAPKKDATSAPFLELLLGKKEDAELQVTSLLW